MCTKSCGYESMAWGSPFDFLQNGPYPDKFTCLNTFMMKLAQLYLDNGGFTVLFILLI